MQYKKQAKATEFPPHQSRYDCQMNCFYVLGLYTQDYSNVNKTTLGSTGPYGQPREQINSNNVTHTHSCTHARARAHTHTYTHRCARAHTHTHARTHARTHTHTHTHIGSHTYARSRNARGHISINNVTKRPFEYPC